MWKVVEIKRQIVLKKKNKQPNTQTMKEKARLQAKLCWLIQLLCEKLLVFLIFFLFFILKIARRWKMCQKSSSHGLLLPLCCAAPLPRTLPSTSFPAHSSHWTLLLLKAFLSRKGIFPWPLWLAGSSVRDLPQQPHPTHPCGYYTQFIKYSFYALLEVCQHLLILSVRCGPARCGPVCMNGCIIQILFV